MALIKTLAGSRYGTRRAPASSGGGSQVARALAASQPAAVPQFFTHLASPSQPPLTHNEEATGGTTYVPPPAAPPPNNVNPATSPARAKPAPPAPDANVDYSGDPVYQQVLSLTNRGTQDAESSALAQRKQAVIDYGHQPGTDVGGIYPDQQTAQAAEANPFSTLATLSHGYDRNLNSIADAFNQKNLFYGSTRGTAEGQAGQDYELARSQAAGQLNDTLSGIAQALLAARQQDDAQRIDAANAAYGRAVDFALQYGTGAAGADAGGASGVAGPAGLDTGLAPVYGSPGVQPATYASVGASPEPISSALSGGAGFSPAPMPTVPTVDLAALARALYSGAGGQTGGNTPILSVIPRHGVRAV